MFHLFVNSDLVKLRGGVSLPAILQTCAIRKLVFNDALPVSQSQSQCALEQAAATTSASDAASMKAIIISQESRIKEFEIETQRLKDEITSLRVDKELTSQMLSSGQILVQTILKEKAALQSKV